jgi:hypothetical protein
MGKIDKRRTNFTTDEHGITRRVKRKEEQNISADLARFTTQDSSFAQLSNFNPFLKILQRFYKDIPIVGIRENCP